MTILNFASARFLPATDAAGLRGRISISSTPEGSQKLAGGRVCENPR